MFSFLVVDCNEKFPEFDYQVWHLLPWKGTHIPIGRHLGEWIYIGRILE